MYHLVAASSLRARRRMIRYVHVRALLMTVLGHCSWRVGFDSPPPPGLLARPEHSETNAVTETRNY